MDFQIFRAGDHGRLVARHARFFRAQRRTKDHVPRRGDESIAVALEGFAIAGHRLLKHLRLTATMFDGSEQPQIIPVAARMLGELQEMAADQ